MLLKVLIVIHSPYPVAALAFGIQLEPSSLLGWPGTSKN